METKWFTLRTVEDKESIAQAADILRRGGLLAIPTETVYGLAGNGLDPAAVAQIYEIKGRPAVKPLSLMVHDASAMARYCADVPPAAYTLAEAFWPGPLTIVLRAQDCVPEIVHAGGQTVGLRCPDHPLTLELLEKSRELKTNSVFVTHEEIANSLGTTRVVISRELDKLRNLGIIGTGRGKINILDGAALEKIAGL